MPAYTDTTAGQGFNGTIAAGVVVAPVQMAQCGVISRFYADFHYQEGLTVQLFKIIQNGGRKTIGARADDKACNILYRKGFFIKGFQLFGRTVSVGVRLEIGQIL